MTELGYHVHFLDADRKLKSMMNLQEQLQKGRITYTEVKSSLSVISLKARAQEAMKYYPKSVPQGYLEVCNIIDKWESEPLNEPESTVLVIDSLSRISEHLKRLLKHFGKKPKMGFDEWDAYLANLEELSDTFFNLQPEPYAHCILIAHSRPEYGDGGSVLNLTPHVDGQFKDKLGTYVEEMYFCECEIFGKQAQAKFKVTTKPVGLIKHARSSRDVKTYIDANMKQILSDEGGK